MLKERKKLFNFFIIFIISVTVFYLYWYDIRPVKVIKNCYQQARIDARALLKKKTPLSSNSALKKAAELNLYLHKDYERYYKNCMRSFGLD